MVEPGAQLDDGVQIGAYCLVGTDVLLCNGCVLHSHVVIGGHTSVGPRTQIFPFASIGLQPQDLKYNGELSTLEIGSDNVIREHVTMNPGTEGGGMVTKIGNGCLFMVGVHIGHDCQVGNQVIMANNATLAGHVTVQDFAVLGGLSAVHQFARIGRYAMIGGVTGVERDVIPFGSVIGDRARLSGINIIGMKRRGLSREEIHDVRKAYRLLFTGEGTYHERLEEVAIEFPSSAPVIEIINFIRADSARKICQPEDVNDL
ncbi:acyl-[acyl-carrier-protein]-UDP-N- acetylglucosamine O-acyltransferase [Candidatus Endolissoclinum faulkneri L5]|uniref:Acyl-[acyl-carrier-protein]-UDP-N-acetylglucosamine O-acyltransferase n=2 Tax=Candidatus Endolissoclinum faulkneri TaxID=1263979 RepID=V9TVI3_9PROT|nr:acyl-[acyl-carrier-protein]-UDP-N- acetylglucosamine O-acyltransferase [Candidatus Endolissoclinum faulkneri L5]